MRRNRSERRLRKHAIAVAIVTSITALKAVVAVSAGQSSTAKTQLYPWAFKGAYAENVGSATMDGIPFSINRTIQVMSVNGTKAEVLVITTDAVPPDPPRSDRQVMWWPATRSDDPPFVFGDNELVISHYDTSIMIGDKVILVTAYSVRESTQSGLTILNFLNKDVHFPSSTASRWTVCRQSI